jgi:2-C-methyl-D-erythritol 4-phosphate cytidylyltransferase
MLKGKPLIAWTLESLCRPGCVDEVILVVKKQAREKAEKIVRRYGFTKVKKIIPGGRRRCDSVGRGLKAVCPDTDIVLVHDGARPILDQEIIKNTVYCAKKYGAAAAGVPVKPTIKQIDKKGFVRTTLKRDKIWEIQTPQGFKKQIIAGAYKKLDHHKKDATDDAYLVERMGRKVKLVKGSYRNIKVTTPEDLKIAEAILKAGK